MFINENHTKIVTSILLPNTSELERSMFVNVYSILTCLIKLLSLSKVKTIEEITLAAGNVWYKPHTVLLPSLFLFTMNVLINSRVQTSYYTHIITQKYATLAYQ